MEWLWPIRSGKTIFDVWSIIHLCFWIVIGANIEAIRCRNNAAIGWWLPILITLAGAYAWEVFERFVAEPLGFVRHPEAWLNRWVSDPLVGVIGVLIGIWIIAHQ